MRKPLNVVVEPLSPRRWVRVERSLFARFEAEMPEATKGTIEARARGKASLVWLSAAAMVCVASLALVLGTRRSVEQMAEHTSRVTTGVSASHLALPGLAIDVQPESAVVIGGESDKGMLVVVDRGGIVCDVAPRSAEKPLIIQAGEARVKVVGTRFTVSRLGDSARVAVERGLVEVAARGVVARVGAGQVWPAEAPPVAPASPNVADRSGATPAASVRGGKSEAAPSKSAAKAGREPAESSASVGAPASPPEPTRQAQFEAATRLERTQPARASALYQALASGSDSWAQNALYADGRLQASLGNRSEARRLLGRYRTRFPHGTNAEDARAVLEGLK